MLGKLKNYLKETRHEFRYVNWPTRAETMHFTLVVIGISALVAVFLGFADFFFGLLLRVFVL